MKNQKLNFIYTLYRDFQKKKKKKKALEDGIRRSKENYRNKIGKFNLKNQLNKQEFFLKKLNACIFILFYVHAWVCVCVSCMSRSPNRSETQRGQKTLNPLELWMWTDIWVLLTEPGSFTRAASTHKCRVCVLRHVTLCQKYTFLHSIIGVTNKHSLSLTTQTFINCIDSTCFSVILIHTT